MIGQTLGHYKIEAKLGEGGMGVVYRALDTHLDRPVAVKVLPAQAVADPERKRRFVQEAKAASALNHPNIIHVYDIDEANGVDFIAMEYVAGKSLEQSIGRKGLGTGEALKYAIQIADALATAHAAGIVHRDLKPANVMVSDKGLVKILDFGLAKLTEKEEEDEGAAGATRTAGAGRTEQGMIVGTVAHMSPEQAEGKKVDRRSDIFSFGSMLYEMLAARKAFQGESRMSTLSAVLREEPKPLREFAAEVPRELERIVTHCLRKDPDRRFQHMDDIKTLLEELKEESESGKLAAAPVGAAPKRRLAPVIGAAAVLAAAIGGGTWYWMSRRAQPAAAPLKVVPLTTFPGHEVQPALSPDGNQVAFVWDGDKQDNQDIYIKLIDGGPPLRLTTDPARDLVPAWAPDGRRIAFRRITSDTTAIYVIPALGGPERRVAFSVGGGSLSWSADGKWLVSEDRDASQGKPAIFQISAETGEKRRLTSPPEGYLGDVGPALSADGWAVAFYRFRSSRTAALYRLSLDPDGRPQGEPRALTKDDLDPTGGIAWTPDGATLVFSATRGGRSALWRLAAGHGAPEAPQAIQLEGESVASPSMPRQAAAGTMVRLAYVHASFDFNIWQAPGRSAPRGEPTKLIASTWMDSSPQFSPDGRRIAFISTRSGSNEVWVSDSEGAQPVQLTNFGGPHVGSPRWSPDGQFIVFDAYPATHSDVYVVRSEGGAPRRLTTEPSNDVRPSWSRDGKWIYFGSDRGGRNRIWKMPAEGGAAVPVTQSRGHEAFESTDGKFVFFADNRELGIWRVPVDGGEETKVLDEALVGRWAVSKSGFYRLNIGAPVAFIDFVSLAGGPPVEVARFPKARFTGSGNMLSVSPDERWLLYLQTDRDEMDIMLVENFR